MGFKIIASDNHARYGQLTVNGKEIQTPAFVPTAPLNQENCLISDEMSACHVQGLTVNLTDLLWRFGPERLQQNITLPPFLSWQGLLLARLGENTDLATHVRKFSAKGLQFHSPVNGQKYCLSPEEYINILQQLSPDLTISFHYQCSKKYAKGMSSAENDQLLSMNDHWCQLSRKTDGSLIAFVPFCSNDKLQADVIDGISSNEAAGYAFDNATISISKGFDAFQKVSSKLATEKFRFISAINTIDELIMAISCGCDLIESKQPLKKAAAGQLFASDGEIDLNEKSPIKNGSEPIDSHCNCYTCKNFTRGYLQYLSWNNIMLGQRLNAIHNIYFYQQLMLNIQQAIKQGCWQSFRLRLRQGQGSALK